MDYAKIYTLLIEKAKLKLNDGYAEYHHIVPKSFGGTNEVENLVSLTAREHFVAHRLLAKMYPGTGMVHAAYFMACTKRVEYQVNSRVYEILRKEHALRVSTDDVARVKKSKSLTGRKQTEEHKKARAKARKNNGKPWHSKETKAHIAEALVGKPSGQRKGRAKSEKEYAAHLIGVETRKNNGSYTRTAEMNKAVSDAQKGKVRTAESIRKTSEGLKRNRVICPYCGLESTKSVMMRWHFDKCKKNPNILLGQLRID